MGAAAVYQPKLLSYDVVKVVHGVLEYEFMHNPDRWRPILVQLRWGVLNLRYDNVRFRQVVLKEHNCVIYVMMVIW